MKKQLLTNTFIIMSILSFSSAMARNMFIENKTDYNLNADVGDTDYVTIPAGTIAVFSSDISNSRPLIVFPQDNIIHGSLTLIAPSNNNEIRYEINQSKNGQLIATKVPYNQ